MYRAVTDRREFGNRPGRVEKTDLHGNFTIVNSHYGHAAFPPEEIIQRAESKVSLIFSMSESFFQIGSWDFNMIRHNCEHFATWCRFGDEMSKTVDELPPVQRWIGSRMPFLANIFEGCGRNSGCGRPSKR